MTLVIRRWQLFITYALSIASFLLCSLVIHHHFALERSAAPAPASSVHAMGGPIGLAPPSPETLTYGDGGVFGGAGVWQTGPLLAIPTDASWLSVVATYQGGGSGAQGAYRVLLCHGSQCGYEQVVGTVDGGTLPVQVDAGIWQYQQAVGPQMFVWPVTNAIATSWSFRADVRGGWDHVRIDFEELAQSSTDAGVLSPVTVTWSFE